MKVYFARATSTYEKMESILTGYKSGKTYVILDEFRLRCVILQNDLYKDDFHLSLTSLKFNCSFSTSIHRQLQIFKPIVEKVYKEGPGIDNENVKHFYLSIREFQIFDLLQVEFCLYLFIYYSHTLCIILIYFYRRDLIPKELLNEARIVDFVMEKYGKANPINEWFWIRMKYFVSDVLAISTGLSGPGYVLGYIK